MIKPTAIKITVVMDYIEWCERVLMCVAQEGERTEYVKNHGIDSHRLTKLIFGDRFEELKNNSDVNRFTDVVDDPLYDLEELSLLKDDNDRYKLTMDGTRALNDLNWLYKAVCTQDVPEPEASVLDIIARLTAGEGHHYAPMATEEESYVIYREFTDSKPENASVSETQINDIINDLRGAGLIFCERGMYPGDIRINYRGMIWLSKRSQVFEDSQIEGFVNEWETTNVDFKRELRVNTASEKAEFIKDVVGLANTKTSGERWLIVGFDDKTRRFQRADTLPPWHETIDQDRLEQLISAYVRPNINIRYALLPYRDGYVGKLQVLRDGRDLPYSVMKSIGDKTGKRVEQGDIYVRHGSHTVKPDDLELADLIQEAERATQQIH